MKGLDPDDAESAVIPPLEPHVVVLVGASGDLARRKLLPGLLHLSRSGLMPEYRIIGTSLDEMGDDGFRDVVREACEEHGRGPVRLGEWDAFARRLRYVPQGGGPPALADAVAAADRELGGSPRRLHYLSVPPQAAESVVACSGRPGSWSGPG